VARGRISGGTGIASPYAKSRGGVIAGLSVPRWQVQHVTTWRPPKLSLLSAVIICTMRRAVRFRGGSSSHFGFDVPAPVWQSPQHTLREVEKKPIVPMNSSTGMPLSTWMFLKTVSDICGVAPPAAWPPACGSFVPLAANATLIVNATMIPATASVDRLDQNFICLSL
jgi:hypothetical protein